MDNQVSYHLKQGLIGIRICVRQEIIGVKKEKQFSSIYIPLI